MSMSTHVVGFIPPDDRFHAMKTIWDNCKVVEIDPPKEIAEFFGDCSFPPDDNGIETEIPHHEWSDGDMRQGIEIQLDEIPENVKSIRFFNSW